MSLKKALVALLVVAMVLGTIGPVFAAEEASDAAIRLQALGIVQGDDQGNLNEDQPVTRAEAAALVVRALGLKKSAELMNGTTKFADVNADPGLQWATGAINVAVANGIINGYPNGQFGGRDHVTFEQFAKMMLYALNYGVTVEGGVWPTAVLAKADDLDLTDGITMVPGVPMTRGDVFKMIDNGLDVPTLKQTGYGDLKQYEETGETLLQKIGLDEIVGWVTAIPAVDDQLDDNEVEIEVIEENGEDITDSDGDGDVRTYSVLEGIDVAALFGVKVKAWVNDDDEIVFAQVETKAKDIIFDTVTGKDADSVDLKVLDDTVDLGTLKGSYANYGESGEVLKAGSYGKFVLDKNKVVFYSVFNFDKSAAVVTAVEDDVVEYFDANGNDRKLRLDDYDAVTFFKPDFSAADLDDVTKDSVLYWWENDDDELFVVIAGSVVEGKLERVRDDELKLDGKVYDVNTANATVSSNDDDDIVKYDPEAPEVEDLVGTDVEVILDINGEVRHVRGDAETTSDEIYGIATDAYRSGADYILKVFTADGEEVAYAVEEKADWAPYNAYFEDYDKSEATTPYLPVTFELNSDGEIDGGTLKLVLNAEWPTGFDLSSFDVASGVAYDGVDEFDDDD